jgi:hypothetical protein
MWRVVRAAGHRSFVALACGRPAPELSDERESTAEEPASTPEGSSAAPADTREHYVYQYALAAYLAGAEGVVFYIFDGTPADRAWSLVDPTGQDIDGKWSALQAAIAEVRASGAPTAASRAATAPQSRSR